MALSVGVNSYVSHAEAVTYFADRIDTDDWDLAVLADQEKALMTATRILDDRVWIGQAVSSTQSLAWPRSGAVYVDPRMGRLIQLTEDVYPDRLKWATFELALHILHNENMLDSNEQLFEEIKVGSISINPLPQGHKKIPEIPLRVSKLINPLLMDNNSRAVWRYN